MQASDGEGGKRFVQSADHNPAFVVPCRLCAAFSQEGTDIPRQEGKANGPEGGIDGIDGKIDFRRESAQVMEDSRHDERANGYDGYSKEL